MHSTETSLLFTLNNVYRASDSGKPTAFVALDLSAAFDTIDHEILLNRRYISFGVSGYVWLWLQSYLSDRSQQVSIAGQSSPPTKCTVGVPQGSVLGPLLFSLYIAPVGHLISTQGIMHQQYADDTQLYIELLLCFF